MRQIEKTGSCEQKMNTEYLKELLKRAFEMAERAAVMDITTPVQMFLALAVLLFGLLNCVLGFRLLRFWVMIAGFVLGGTLAVLFVRYMGIDDNMIFLAAGIVAGIILAILAFLIYRAGIFILAAVLGLVGSIYILHPRTSAVFFACILIGVILGTLSFRFSKQVIIVGTGLFGGVLSSFSISRLLDLDLSTYGIILAAVLVFTGIVIQFAMNRSAPSKSTDVREIDEEDVNGRASEEVEEAYSEWNRRS